MSLFSTISSRIRIQMQRHSDPTDPDHQNKAAMNANMATLEADLKKQILGRSKAEKVFRPWWDTLEDYLLNSLVLLGKWRKKKEVQNCFLKSSALCDCCSARKVFLWEVNDVEQKSLLRVLVQRGNFKKMQAN